VDTHLLEEFFLPDHVVRVELSVYCFSYELLPVPRLHRQDVTVVQQDTVTQVTAQKITF
jgi:hypothetical protein